MIAAAVAVLRRRRLAPHHAPSCSPSGRPSRYGLFFAAAGQDESGRAPTIGRADRRSWSRIATRRGILVILVTGLYLTDDRWDFSDFFVVVGRSWPS